VFLLTRAIDTVMIILAARHQIALDGSIAGYKSSTPTPAQPGYLGVVTNWDAQWYWQIAIHGYPDKLPVVDGSVAPNEWAFAPLYPFTVRALMYLTGLGFAASGTAVTLTTSLAGVLLSHRLVAETAGTSAARATTLVLCTAMAAPVFQIAYTEGPALLLVVLTLWLLRRERYGLTALSLLALGLTRHVAAPFVIVLAVHSLRKRRRTGSWSRATLGLLLAGLAITGLWPVTAAVVTRRLTAFTDTPRAWRVHSTTGPFGLFSVGWGAAGATGVLIVACAAAAVLWLALRRNAPRWGPEVRAWAAAYPMYLFAVAPVAVSMFRLMLLAFPLAWVLREDRSTTRSRLVTLVVLGLGGLALQWFWIRYMLVFGPPGDHVAIP
jgi:MFS family permease